MFVHKLHPRWTGLTELLKNGKMSSFGPCFFRWTPNKDVLIEIYPTNLHPYRPTTLAEKEPSKGSLQPKFFDFSAKKSDKLRFNTAALIYVWLTLSVIGLKQIEHFSKSLV